MRILHTSDWHLGKTLEGRDRQEEQVQVLDEICKIAEEEQVDLVLIAGDVYQTVNPPAWAENLFYETVHRLSNFGRRGVVVIAGNHDQPERVRAANPLADKQGIYLIGLPHDEIKPNLFQREGHVITKRTGLGWFEIKIPTCDQLATISVLPYPSEARLKQLFVDSADLKEIRNAYSHFVGNWFEAQRQYFSRDSINLAVSHFYTRGGVATDSEVEIQVGGAYTVDPTHIPDFFQYVALGHLHRPQLVKGTKGITRYSGSPLAYSFSEANHKKSVSLIEAKPSEEVVIREILLTSGKPLIQKKISNGIEELEVWLNGEGNASSWLDLEVHVQHPLSIEEIQRIRKLHDGIVNIRLITPKERIEQEVFSLSDKTPNELFARFYEYRRGAAPRKEVIELFDEIFMNQNEGEEV